MTDNDNLQTTFVKRLVEIISEDLLGVGNRHSEVDEDFPKNVYPSGNLGSVLEQPARMEDFRITEYTPSSLGLLFRLPAAARGILEFKGTFNVFYPKSPTLGELRLQAARYESGFPKDEARWADAAQVNPILNSRLKYRPVYVRRKVEFSATLDASDLVVDGDYHEIPTSPSLSDSLRALSMEAQNDDHCLRIKNQPKSRKAPATLIGANLRSSEDLEAALQAYDTKATPRWNAAIKYRAWRKATENCVVVEILLSNQTTFEEDDLLSDIGQETHLFHPSLQLTTKVESLVPFELASLRSKNYRVNSFVYSSGINCDVTETTNGENINLETDVLPVLEQKRLVPTKLEGYKFGMPSPAELAVDPIKHLTKLSGYLHSYSEWWKNKGYEELLLTERISFGVETDLLEAQLDFEKEVSRFDEGMKALVINEKLLLSFKLMNKSFAINPNTNVREWRLFQLVFIVSGLPALVKRVEGGTASPVVLWYPTGGGKTEGYLGLSITCAFWDRLRGKKFGVTAWAKFPLRLLSIQQLSRIMAAVSYADIVRAESVEIPIENKGDQFSVGLYAGGYNSTNDLDWPHDAARKTALTQEAQEFKPASPESLRFRKNHKIDLCPVCRQRGYADKGKVLTTFVSSKPGFVHKCVQCGYLLPLHVTDTETLRFLPTMIVSTIDKLAELGRENSTKILFGYAQTNCPKHGYFLQDSGSCNVLGCGEGLLSVRGAIDPGPEIVIQDEMHFLRETLGAFDSHYETMMLAIMRKARRELGSQLGGPWNIVGSSATIEGYSEQVKELYCAPDATRFPVSGPAKGMDAYATESDETQRFIIGFRPQNMSHVDAVMKVLLSFHRTTLRLVDPKNSLWEELGEPFQSMNAKAREDLMQFYRTSLTYCLLKTEAGQIHKSFVGQLNPILSRDRFPPFEEFRIPNLTGESDATAVADVLYRLEKSDGDWVQAITATSIISHGVDLDILNFMVFRGQPHTVGEWIQAMSRVGRKEGFPSIVVNVYNPNRERDAAYYTHHKKYIEHSGNLIRTVPITRFSISALRKTIRGLFYNILAYYSPPEFRYYYRDALKKELPIRLPFIRGMLLEYYVLDHSNLSPKESRLIQALDSELADIRAQLENPNQPDQTVKTLNPMKSLRDVDEPVSIAPSYDAEYFAWS